MVTGSPESPQAIVVLLWLLFSMIAFYVRSKFYKRRQKRAFSEETKQLLIERMQKKKDKTLLSRHKDRIKSVEKQGWKTTALKKMGGFPQKNLEVQNECLSLSSTRT